MKFVVRDGVKAVAGLIFLVVLLLVARPASARDPDISVGVDTQRVGVGDQVRLTLRVSSSQRPGQPQLGPLRGFTLVGSSSNPSQSVSIVNGQITTRQGLDASWSLRADKTGTWPVGPLTIQIGTNRYASDPINIVVVPAGQAPRQALGGSSPQLGPFGIDPFGGGSPFDPFKGLLDSLNPPREPQSYGADPKLALDEARGSLAFLHATMEPTDVVVGQQVTVSIYLYTDASERETNMTDVHEATAEGFLKRPLFEDDGSNHNVMRAIVGGRLWGVRLLRKWALFPIRPGDLVVTPMDLILVRSRQTGDPSRKTEVLTAHVTEPPTRKRPPGYVLGDVGKFALTADITSRDIEQDGALGVTLDLSGTGNLPAMITPPAQAGVEWLAPEVNEKLGAQPGDKFGGNRTFSYVVRMHQSGNVDLGAIALPYWNPDDQQYHVARAELGTITVRPNPNHASEESAPDPLPNLPAARTSLGSTRPPSAHWAATHPDWFLFGLGVGPVGFVFFSGASSAARALRARAARRSTSPAKELASRMKAAGTAIRVGDVRGTSAATARALEAATVAYLATNVRDARHGEARQRLVDAGAPEDVASSVDALLAECDQARFAPDDPIMADVRGRWERAHGAINALKATRRRA